ncbi:MAG: hypothetical protein ACTSVC_15870 [Promethearchaeota archaeon]
MPLYVKARKHYGSPGLDLTIPADIVRELKLSPGDLFLVKSSNESGNVKIEYHLIYKT